MDWHVHSWQDIGAIATGGSFLIGAFALIYAGRQLSEAKNAREATATQAREIQEAQTRPYVVVDFDMSVASYAIELEVANLGSTAARDVRIEFDPPLVSTNDDERSRIADAEMWRLIPMLAPGRRRHALFDTAPARMTAKEQRPELVDTYRARVTYRGDLGGDQYSDEFVLDLASHQRVTKLERYGVHNVVRELKEIDKTLNSYKRDRDALRVVTESVEGRRERHKAEAKMMRQRQIDAQAEAEPENTESSIEG